ncbi:MAG: hypothetical protein HC780_04150 [Leptolyngbyaceae cyanobacterium CSU_1_3]|nr:hypothetical protein [Leptolyngbyaceae cyanobacterium CSU_1_3]
MVSFRHHYLFWALPLLPTEQHFRFLGEVWIDSVSVGQAQHLTILARLVILLEYLRNWRNVVEPQLSAKPWRRVFLCR